MAQCHGGGHASSLPRSHQETIDGLCHGLLDLDDDKFSALCSAFGYLQEWPPNLGAICGTNLGAPSMPALDAGTGNSSSSCSGSVSGGSRKRKPDDCTDAKGDHKGNSKRPRGKQQVCDLGETAGEGKQERAKEGAKKKAEAAAAGQKADYIHVRARRGQATDSHSLAERVRRERISERMRFLQELVPGCSKVTGKAGMLDEIINYVQSLQKQVEFLSMKIAASNPVVSFDIVEDLFGRQLKQACNPAALTAMAHPQQSCLQMSHMQQAHPPSGSLDFGMEMVVSSPYPTAPGGASMESCLNVNGAAAWDIGSQNMFSGFDAQFQSVESNSFPDNLKMEM